MFQPLTSSLHIEMIHVLFYPQIPFVSVGKIDTTAAAAVAVAGKSLSVQLHHVFDQVVQAFVLH